MQNPEGPPRPAAAGIVFCWSYVAIFLFFDLLALLRKK